MEEIFKEYGGAVLAMLGTGLLMALVINRLMGDGGVLAPLLLAWGRGGI